MNFIEWFWDETTTWLVQFLTQQIKYWKMKLGGEVLKWACVEFHQVAAGNIWTNPSNFVITQILEGPLNRIVYDIMNDFITRKKQNKQCILNKRENPSCPRYTDIKSPTPDASALTIFSQQIAMPCFWHIFVMKHKYKHMFLAYICYERQIQTLSEQEQQVWQLSIPFIAFYLSLKV